MSDPNKPATLIRATPALLDGWCGPVLLHRTRVCVVGLDGDGYPIVWPAVTRAHPIEVEHLDLDLARPEVQDRVCRVLCGHPEVELRVHIAWTFVIIAHAWGSPIVASCSLPGRHVPTIPALATCATLPEALAVWWAHDQETP